MRGRGEGGCAKGAARGHVVSEESGGRKKVKGNKGEASRGGGGNMSGGERGMGMKLQVRDLNEG